MSKREPSTAPKKEPVLVWMEDSEIPFVGFWDFKDGLQEWYINAEYANSDRFEYDVFGSVYAWEPLPKKPTE